MHGVNGPINHAVADDQSQALQVNFAAGLEARKVERIGKVEACIAEQLKRYAATLRKSLLLFAALAADPVNFISLDLERRVLIAETFGFRR